MTIWAPTLQTTDGTKYEQIASAIQRDIAAGKLSPGDRLPPQRKLAQFLGVTIGTVGRAYALAERRGLTKSEVGRGCFVTTGHALEGDGVHAPLMIDLGINFPPAIEDDRVFEHTLLELSQSKNRARLFGPVPVDAFPHHREAAAQWLRPRIECNEKDVLICAGTQSALIASLSALTRPGDGVFVESQTFPGILSALRLLDRTPIPIPMDAEGVIPSAIDVSRGKVVFLNPTNQNPTSTCLSLARRMAIADLVEKHELWLVEDDTYGHLCPDVSVSISSLIRERSVLITSISKSMTVGLRLAFIRVPNTIRESVLSQLHATTFFPSTIAVEIVSKWINDGTAKHFVDARSATAKRRREIALTNLPASMLPTPPMLNHVWLELPDSWTPTTFCRAAEENGVMVLPSRVFSPTPECETNCVRVAIGAARTDEELLVGLQKLSRLLDCDSVETSARF